MNNRTSGPMILSPIVNTDILIHHKDYATSWCKINGSCKIGKVKEDSFFPDWLD